MIKALHVESVVGDFNRIKEVFSDIYCAATTEPKQPQRNNPRQKVLDLLKALVCGRYVSERNVFWPSFLPGDCNEDRHIRWIDLVVEYVDGVGEEDDLDLPVWILASEMSDAIAPRTKSDETKPPW